MKQTHPNELTSKTQLMKKILYTLTAILVLTSCRSIDKMVEHGNYEEAFRYAVDKLQGKKKKKTKYVKGLEKAYARLNAEDLRHIARLETTSSISSLEDIISIYKKMDRRQEYINPLLPLYSNEGYAAQFEFTNYSSLIKTKRNEIHEIKLNIAEDLYKEALHLLELARTSDSRQYGRRAYRQFNKIDGYISNYKDSDILRTEARRLGISHIIVETYAAGSNLAFDHAIEIVSLFNTQGYNWTRLYTSEAEIEPDFIATIEIAEILPGSEREQVRSFVEKQEIITGQIPIIDTNGNEVTDTSGNVLMTDKYEIVTAYIEELEREKIAKMNGKVTIINTRTNSHIKTIPISAVNVFDDYSCIFRGDKRALEPGTFKRLRTTCQPFPTDYEMTTDLAYEFKTAAEAALKKQLL